MKLLTDIVEYRTWLFDEYLLFPGSGINPLMNNEEVEELLFQNRPRFFPCIAYVTPSERHPGTAEVKYISKEQVEHWAGIMGSLPARNNDDFMNTDGSL
ncbi:hypothetical protein CYR55_07610 [Chimaeribacter californicus]|uniref:Uncharacterized protein n=1 Tax=Chimaeribacter californicus TaxID=2060067 RepID=A0A2N5EC52_9GAMM|nr:hypothetical protein [Chimaeribacter californicus]PLR39726.1 hypothetical protein CYR55_07610 [Chimaeribacter californicus]